MKQIIGITLLAIPLIAWIIWAIGEIGVKETFKFISMVIAFIIITGIGFYLAYP